MRQSENPRDLEEKKGKGQKEVDGKAPVEKIQEERERAPKRHQTTANRSCKDPSEGKGMGVIPDCSYITMRPETLEKWKADEYEVKGFELSSKGVYKVAVIKKGKLDDSKKGYKAKNMSKDKGNEWQRRT